MLGKLAENTIFNHEANSWRESKMPWGIGGPGKRYLLTSLHGQDSQTKRCCSPVYLEVQTPSALGTDLEEVHAD